MKFINIETEESQESTQQTINYSRSDYINIDLPYDDLYLMDTVATDSFDNEPKKIELINPINIQGLDKCYQSLQYFTIDNLFSELQTSVLKELARKNLGIDLNTISVKGDIKLGIINLSQLDNVKQAQSELTETNQIAYFIITDNSGKLPSKQTAYSVPTNVVRQLLFASPNPTTLTLLNIVASKVSFSSIGVNVGDLIALTRIKVKVSDLANVVDITISEASEIELYLYKILATNDAKPYNYNGITQGVMGLMSPWDKTEVNKIRGIENVANAALPRIDYLPSKWENNMNNCLETGVYPWCTLGRPEGSTGAYTCISIKSSTNDGNYYTIEQTAYGRLNELGLIYKRIIFYKKDGTDTLYHDWINISDSFKTNYYTKDESVELFAKKTSVEANNEKISKILSGETPVEKANKLTNKRTISLSGYAVSNTPSFDGSSNVNISVNSINDRGLLLGLSAKEGDYYRATMTPIDTANLEFSTNRLAFNKPECITIEYSNDGGNTWLDYEATDILKIGFISGMEIPFFLGKNITALTANQDMLRIKINHNRGAYTNMQRLYIYLSTHGAMVDNSHSLLCKVEKSLCKDPENLSLVGNYLVTGWSGWNSINIDGYFGTVSDTNIHTIQLTFSFNNLSSAYISKTKAKIMKLQMLGNTVFNNSTGCKLLQTGHIYDYDLYKNVIFPAKLTSTILESNIETGTAPIKVKSTTKVSNLKSEYSEKDVNGNIIHTTYATKLEVENEINRAEKIVRKEDIVNNLIDGGADKVLSAEMGKELQSIISKSSGLFKNYGYYIGPDGLIIETSNPNAITDYIPLDSVDKIIICGRSSNYVSLYAFYDENKNFIAGAYGNEYNNTAITINSSDFPANAKYFIGNGNGNDNDLLLGIGTNGHIITLINSLDNRTQSLEENRVSKYIIKTHPFDIGENDVCKGILDAYESNYDNSLVYYIRTYRADLDSQTRLIVTTKSKETGEIVTNYYLDTNTATILYEDGSYKIYKEGSFIIAINWALIPSTGTTWKQPNAVFSESISNINNGIYIKRYEYEDKVEQLDERLKPVEVTDKLLYLTEDLTSTQQSGYWNGNVVDSENPTFWINSDTLRTVTMDILLGDRIETNSNFSPTKSVPWCLLNKDNYIIQRLNNFNSLIVTEDMVNAGAVKISLCYRTTQMVDTFFVYRTRFVTYDLKNDIKELRNNIANIVPKFGKKVLLFGDSQIGQCRMESNLSQLLNTEVYNFGFGGCRWTWRTSDGSSQWDAYTMVEVADALASKDFTKMDSFLTADDIPSYFANAVAQMKTLELGDGSEYIATIAYGGNDYAGGAKLGEINSLDKTKLYGAINHVISTLLSAYPALTIHVVSPTYRVYEKDTDGSILVDSDEKVVTIDGTQYKRYEYGDKILEHVRDYHRLPTYDMYRRGGRNRYNIYTICPDGTHPTSELGRKLTAEKYEKIIKSF